MKRFTVEQITTFTDDVRRAEAKIARWEEAVEELRPEHDQRPRWDADHDWPDSRLRTIDAELAELTEPARRTTTREASLVRPAPGRKQPAWLDRVAEIAGPPLPGSDTGHGIDLGL